MDRYTVFISKSIQKKLQKLPDSVAENLELAMLKLEDNPRPDNCKKLSTTEAYRIRIGDYRIIYEIQDEVLTIIVLKIGHRKDIYRR